MIGPIFAKLGGCIKKQEAAKSQQPDEFATFPYIDLHNEARLETLEEEGR